MKKIYANSRAREYTKVSTAFIAVMIALIAIFNIIIYALGTKFEWYFYKGEAYEHHIGNTSAELFSDTPLSDTEIIFCMEKEDLEGDIIFNLVWQTALQLQERHDFIKVKNVNIYLQPKLLSKYKYTVNEEGEKVQTATINTNTVIISSEKGHRVYSLSDFFNLNSSSTITAYNGEEVMLSAIAWVQREAHPIAYFTNTHGENYSSLLALYNVLTACGYDVRMLDLFSEKIDEKAELIIMSNPIYDIERASEGSGIISEGEQLDAFLERGGTLFVSLDPYVKSDLTQLKAFLAEWGMTAENSIITDTDNSITHDGYTLVAQYADTEAGNRIYGEVRKHNSSYTVVKDASPITLTKGEKAEAEAVLKSSPAAKAYYNGALASSDGSFTILAMAENNGKVFLSSGAYLTANDILNSKVYSNRELIFTILDEAGCDYSTVGSVILPVGNNMIEGLTTKTADLYAIIFIIIIPLAIAAVAAVILTKRKNR